MNPERGGDFTQSTYFSSCLNANTLHRAKEQVTVYLTHALVLPASRTDFGVGDMEVASVHLSTPLIVDYGEVDRL